jgi:AraC family transcriptional regulator
MTNIDTMLKAVDFIEGNLKEPISVSDVADAVGYSLYHFSRTFNAVVKHSPYDYLMRRRLSESARELLTTRKKIITIALDYQFNNPETYSRAFRRMFGVLPNQLRKDKRVGTLIFKSRMTFEQLLHINKGDYLVPVLVEKPALCFAGIATTIVSGNEQKMELQKRFLAILDRLPDGMRTEHYYGISIYPRDLNTDGFFYMNAVEVERLDDLHPLLVAKPIPPLAYARFTHKGLYRDIGLSSDYIYQTWLPRSGYELSMPIELEYFGPNYLGPHDESSEVEIFIPIKMAGQTAVRLPQAKRVRGRYA